MKPILPQRSIAIFATALPTILALGASFVACSSTDSPARSNGPQDSGNPPALDAANNALDGANDALEAEAPPPFMPPAIQAWRAPAYPLVASDPYFSIWSFSDNLCQSWPRHWTGATQALQSMVRVDGRSFRLMGLAPNGVPCATQTSVKVTPTRTVYEFIAASVNVRLTFLTPRLTDDLDVFSRSASYVTWDVRANDGKSHEVAVYFDNSAESVVDSVSQQVTWDTVAVDGMLVRRMGTVEQPVLQKKGDNLRIDWGYLHQAVPAAAGVKQVVAADVDARNAFAANQELPSSDDARKPRAANDAWPVMASTFALPGVGSDWTSRTLILAYDDEYSIESMGTRLRPYWRRNGAGAVDLVKAAQSDYGALRARSEAFDAALVEDLERAGGPNLVRIGALAYRQAMAAHKLVAGTDGKPLFFSKENFSNGCIATVDVTYPSAPLYLLLNPTLLEGMLAPIADYAASARWKFDFAPHDLGTYPIANGQVYGGGETSEENQMPVEESANLVLLFAALAKAQGNTDFATRHWNLLVKWSAYLEKTGFDPGSQLCTDDFAGHLAHNVNLSAKAIVALGAYAQLLDARKMTEEAARVRGVAKEFAAKWLEQSKDGDHTRLAFDKPGTWSQKYNLVWDRILGLGLFPDSVAQKELAYARTRMLGYGLPLDNREVYTKLDWTIWTATLTGNRADFDTLVAPVAQFLNDTPDRVPMSDWYMTSDGHQRGFQARSVVGGVFIPLLYDGPTWQKWRQGGAHGGN
ncbi:DUF4965 domain-containing protein [Pendulispora brunnea]|uniref:DUF4965 domain-containing protein n=1 Tax=Pendulispora brunnea TaxID=2905690 RepID=A0ABZ2KLG2_9BACT